MSSEEGGISDSAEILTESDADDPRPTSGEMSGDKDAKGLSLNAKDLEASLRSPDSVMDDECRQWIEDLRKIEPTADPIPWILDAWSGYGQLAELLAEVMCDLKTIAAGPHGPPPSSATAELIEPLCLQMERRFDSSKLREYMDRNREEGWKPPTCYWKLMESPEAISTMERLYDRNRGSEFLAAFCEDLCVYYPQQLVTTESLSRTTGNFAIFTKLFNTHLSNFLIDNDDDPENFKAFESRMPKFFCHTENAYIYTQAMLHFIYIWRPDYSGCRRLSQILFRHIREEKKEFALAEVNLWFTNLPKFPSLMSLFNSIFWRTAEEGDVGLARRLKAVQAEEVVALHDALLPVIAKFESAEVPLYERAKGERRRDSLLTSRKKRGSRRRRRGQSSPKRYRIQMPPSPHNAPPASGPLPTGTSQYLAPPASPTSNGWNDWIVAQRTAGLPPPDWKPPQFDGPQLRPTLTEECIQTDSQALAPPHRLTELDTPASPLGAQPQPQFRSVTFEDLTGDLLPIPPHRRHSSLHLPMPEYDEDIPPPILPYISSDGAAYSLFQYHHHQQHEAYVEPEFTSGDFISCHQPLQQGQHIIPMVDLRLAETLQRQRNLLSVDYRLAESQQIDYRLADGITLQQQQQQMVPVVDYRMDDTVEQIEEPVSPLEYRIVKALQHIDRGIAETERLRHHQQQIPPGDYGMPDTSIRPPHAVLARTQHASDGFSLGDYLQQQRQQQMLPVDYRLGEGIPQTVDYMAAAMGDTLQQQQSQQAPPLIDFRLNEAAQQILPPSEYGLSGTTPQQRNQVLPVDYRIAEALQQQHQILPLDYRLADTLLHQPQQLVPVDYRIANVMQQQQQLPPLDYGLTDTLLHQQQILPLDYRMEENHHQADTSIHHQDDYTAAQSLYRRMATEYPADIREDDYIIPSPLGASAQLPPAFWQPAPAPAPGPKAESGDDSDDEDEWFSSEEGDVECTETSSDREGSGGEDDAASEKDDEIYGKRGVDYVGLEGLKVISQERIPLEEQLASAQMTADGSVGLVVPIVSEDVVPIVPNTALDRKNDFEDASKSVVSAVRNIRDMQSASQTEDVLGGPDLRLEFERLRVVPEVPPLEALRETLLLEALFDSVVSTQHLDPEVLRKTAEVLLALTIYDTYEIAVRIEAEQAASAELIRREQQQKKKQQEAAAAKSEDNGNGNGKSESTSSAWAYHHIQQVDASQLEEAAEAASVEAGETAVVESALFANVPANQRLARPLPWQLSKLKEHEFAERMMRYRPLVQHCRNLARKEIFEIYRIIREPLYSSLALKCFYLDANISTVVGASLVMHYFEKIVLESDGGPLCSITPAIYVVLMHICIHHEKKIDSIVNFFRKMLDRDDAGLCQPPENILNPNEYKSNMRKRMMDFFTWLCGIGAYTPVLRLLEEQATKMDWTLLRAELEVIIRTFRAPLSKNFCEAFLRVLGAAAQHGVLTSGGETKMRLVLQHFLADVWGSFGSRRLPPKVERLCAKIDAALSESR